MDKLVIIGRIVLGLLRTTALCLLVAILMQTVLVFLFQQHIIYHPSPYPGGRAFEASFPRPLVELPYAVDGAAQVAFYSPTKGGNAMPAHIWILFGGNGSHALEYKQIPSQPGLLNDGFLFVDYPGYGLNGGTPSPAAILQGAQTALAALAKHLGTTVGELNPRLGIVGHSIGTGAALDLALADPGITRVILVSPFTSLCGMARLMLGYPVCALVRHNIDNEAALDTLATRSPRPAVTILHGAKDAVIPVAMSRRMAAEHPGWIDYREQPDYGHVDIVIDDAPVVAKAMEEMEGPVSGQIP